jgi:3-oxosteroid 1-dehydrogenase
MTTDVKEVDVLVVGSGNAGLTAAICAYELGLENVLVVEKSHLYGGTSATSGGMIWAPCSLYTRDAGVIDSPEAARRFLADGIPGDAVAPELLDTYVREVPRLLQFLHDRTQVRYRPVYFRGLTGESATKVSEVVRCLEPEPIDRTVLGPEAAHLRETHRLHWLFGRIAMSSGEAMTLLQRMPGWRRVFAQRVWSYISDVPWVFSHRRSRAVACGAAGIARLRLSLVERGIPLWLESPFRELTTGVDGRVDGAIVSRRGKRVRVRARHGVILASGGFESNQAMREQHLPKPTSTRWSAANGNNTGDGINAGIALGAATRHMGRAFWSSTYSYPGSTIAWLANLDKSYPGSCVVNAAGERIANESLDYMEFQEALFSKHTDAQPQVPSWMVFDARFRRRYFVGPISYGYVRPDWTLPRSHFSSGFLSRGATLRELARTAGIDADGLERSVAAMNDYARTGHDAQFGRGSGENEMCFPDPTVGPNPFLAPIREPPFYAMRMEPGDFGTIGGLVTDADARVLDQSGAPIVGLYAAGLAAAAVAPTYPSPGLSLGPAMVLAWQAARHMAQLSSERAETAVLVAGVSSNLSANIRPDQGGET